MRAGKFKGEFKKTYNYAILMYCRKIFFSANTNELIETNSISLISGTIRHWGSYLSPSSQQRTSRTVQLSSIENSSAKYTIFRDELEDYVTVIDR